MTTIISGIASAVGLFGIAIIVVLLDDCINGKSRAEQEVAQLWLQEIKGRRHPKA